MIHIEDIPKGSGILVILDGNRGKTVPISLTYAYVESPEIPRTLIAVTFFATYEKSLQSLLESIPKVNFSQHPIPFHIDVPHSIPEVYVWGKHYTPTAFLSKLLVNRYLPLKGLEGVEYWDLMPREFFFGKELKQTYNKVE